MTGAAIWATTLAYGMNAGPEVIPGDVVNLTTHAGLLESTLSLGDRRTWFGRAELRREAWTQSAHARDSSDNLHRRESSGWIRPILLDRERHRSGYWRDGVRRHHSPALRTAVPEAREPGRWRLCFDPARAAWESVVMLPRRVRLESPFPPPHPHRVVAGECVAQIARQQADLAAVVCVVLHQIGQHVDDAARHAFHTRLPRPYRRFEQTREIVRRLVKRLSRLRRSRCPSIKRRDRAALHPSARTYAERLACAPRSRRLSGRGRCEAPFARCRQAAREPSIHSRGHCA